MKNRLLVLMLLVYTTSYGQGVDAIATIIKDTSDVQRSSGGSTAPVTINDHTSIVKNTIKPHSNTINNSSSVTPQASYKMIRYFIVFYIGTIPNGHATGKVNFQVKDSHYLSEQTVVNWLTEHNADLQDVVITNITELTESDYNDWVSEELSVESIKTK